MSLARTRVTEMVILNSPATPSKAGSASEQSGIFLACILEDLRSFD